MSRARFSLLTWNVWFGEYAFARRNEYILNLIERQSVDIICLQEVTHEFLSILAQRSRLVADYDISDNDLSGATIGSYGVLMMCKKELQASYHFTEFPTGMGRSLLSAELALDGQHSNVGGTFCVGTVHLESLDSARHFNYCGEIIQGIALALPGSLLTLAAYDTLTLHSHLDIASNSMLKVEATWLMGTLLLPWLYPLYYVLLFVSRQADDDAVCARKYGPEVWDAYVKAVPYRICPGVY
jgi:hypothetical protein